MGGPGGLRGGTATSGPQDTNEVETKSGASALE